MMKYIPIVFVVLLMCYSCDSNKKTKEIRKPNIVIILADDLGYADVGYNGCKDIPTPNIDAMAKEGIIFTNGYVTGAVCGPTRAGLVTGRYQQRFGSEFLPGPRKRSENVKVGVPLTETFVSTRLKKLGYNTACFGKWHLGGESGDQDLFPLNRGFDKFFGFLEGAALYDDVNNKERKYMRGNEELVMEQEYYTDAITREALTFIDENKDHPFFLYLPYNAVHAPLQAPAKYLKQFDHIQHPKRKLLAAMNYALDLSIGEVLTEIKEKGLEENTLIFFLSDNGGKPKGNYSYNLPLRGEKGQHYEGGVHIPFTVKWKNNIPENITYDKPISSLDIVPTILAAVGEPIQEEWNLDGVNLLPYIKGDDNMTPHETLFWREGNKSAMRTLDWKFVKVDDKVELFNISNDPYETTDLAAIHPEKLEELMKLYDEWNANNIPAQYGRNPKEFPIEVIRTRRTELPR
ncbi:sulfatase [Labilibacter sediminis]|nr:sulfatase [Labilibacter sediminis]